MEISDHSPLEADPDEVQIEPCGRQNIVGASMPNKNFDRRAFLKGAALAGVAPAAQAAQPRRKWDREADVVVVGTGAAGLPAAIIAKENGASVIMIDANDDIGGHAAVCTGNIPLGGGTAAQKAAGIVDSPEIIFKDLTDWSALGSNGAPEYRFNDRDFLPPPSGMLPVQTAAWPPMS